MPSPGWQGPRLVIPPYAGVGHCGPVQPIVSPHDPQEFIIEQPALDMTSAAATAAKRSIIGFPPVETSRRIAAPFPPVGPIDRPPRRRVV